MEGKGKQGDNCYKLEKHQAKEAEDNEYNLYSVSREVKEGENKCFLYKKYVMSPCQEMAKSVYQYISQNYSKLLVRIV